MKIFRLYSKFCILALAVAIPAFSVEVDALAAAGRTVVIATPSTPTPVTVQATAVASPEQTLVIDAVEPEPASAPRKEVSWLGVATEECSEALASQLGLNAGQGLLVVHVVPNSPAAKAEVQKNDVLTEFDSQELVHPAQFRKLILMRKEGDKIKLTLFRAGKKEEIEAVIGKHASPGMSEQLRLLYPQLKEVPVENLKQQMKELQESLKHSGVDKETLNLEVRKSVEEVRQAIQEALRQATNAARTFGPAAREFQELARRGVDVEKDATVVVKSKRNSVKSIVKTDENGTYVIVATPKKQLTAHDKSGKLLFDGSIETTDEQDKVPRDVWEHVKPMLEQLSDEKSELETTEDNS